jgi:TonB family protein
MSMVPLLALASLAPMLWTLGSGAPAVSDTMVEDAKNGEFLWKFYPAGAAKRGEQGRVAFRLTVEPDGLISTCDVTESSGFATLDKETCEIMGLYAHLAPIHDATGRTVRGNRDGFITWKLPPSVATPASPPPKLTMRKPDTVICRRDISTGSLVAMTRMCLPRSEWQLTSEQEKEHWQDMQGKGYTH